MRPGNNPEGRPGRPEGRAGLIAGIMERHAARLRVPSNGVRNRSHEILIHKVYELKGNWAAVGELAQDVRFRWRPTLEGVRDNMQPGEAGELGEYMLLPLGLGE